MSRNLLAAVLATAAILVAVSVAYCSDAQGQTVTAISQLPAVTLPLSRNADLVPVAQCTSPGCTRKATIADIYDPTAPGNLGGTTPGTANFTDLNVSGAVTGSGLSTYLASPPTIGGNTPGLAFFSVLSASSLSVSGSVSGAGFTSLITSQFASPPALGSTAPNAITGTTVTATGKASGTTGLQVNGIDLCSATLPTVSGTGLGTSPSIVASSSCSGDITVGSAPSAASFTVTLATAAHGWSCVGWDITTISTTVYQLRQISGGSTTSCVMEITNTSGVVQAPVAADHLKILMMPQ